MSQKMSQKIIAAMRSTRAALAAVLAEAIEEQGISQAKLADEAEASPGGLSRILGGHGNPTINLITRLAYVLGRRVRIELVPLDKDEKK